MFRMPQSIEDLFYYDGPLMFTAKHPVTDKLIGVNQVDCWPDLGLVWMVFETTEDNIKQLVENKITIYEFIKSNPSVDFWLEENYNGLITEFKDVPLFVVRNDYFPKQGVYLCA